MNKELEERVRNNLGANVLIEYDEQGRKIGYKHIKLLKAAEIINLNKEVEKNKQAIAVENEKKNNQLMLEQKEFEEKRKLYIEEQAFMNKYSLLKFMIAYNFSLLRGLIKDESFFEKDFSNILQMERSIERSNKIKELVESNLEFKNIFELIGGE